MDAPEPRSHLAIVQVRYLRSEVSSRFGVAQLRSLVRTAGKVDDLQTQPRTAGLSIALSNMSSRRTSALRSSPRRTGMERSGRSCCSKAKRPSRRSASHNSRWCGTVCSRSATTRESFAGRKAKPLTPRRVQELRRFLEASMRKLGIPGASFALIDHRQIVFEGGLGVRSLLTQTPVDANTLFLAASLTKGMTTLLLARLIDQGKFAWNEPVSTSCLISSWATKTSRDRYSSSIWSAPARDFPGKIWSGSSNTRTRPRQPRSHSWRTCSRRASSASCSSTAICWLRLRDMWARTHTVRKVSLGPPTTKQCRSWCLIPCK